MSKDYFVHEAGKGSRQRDTDMKKYYKNWDKIFGKKKEEEEKDETVRMPKK
jgi:hypothetical protein